MSAMIYKPICEELPDLVVGEGHDKKQSKCITHLST